jgi:TatD DNase family protein
MLFDTHAHYDDERFEEDRYEIINNAHKEGVSYIINAAADFKSIASSISLSQEFDFVYAAVGIHPHSAGETDENTIEIIKESAGNPKVVAIGEIGLDYYYDNSPREIQKIWFSKQITLARSLNLPIIVHDRDAHEDVMNIIKSDHAEETGGVMHCFSGSVEMARELLNLNFYISIGGPVTFKNAKKVIEVVKYVPLDRLLIETDCPYLTPEPYRGKRNYSGYVRLVAEKIAEIKGVSFEEIAEVTLQNAKMLFKIK